MDIDKDLNYIAGNLLAEVITKNYSNSIFCNSNVDENGFHIDVKLKNDSISTNDFAKLEKLVSKLTTGAIKLEYYTLRKKDALIVFKDNSYITETINDLDQDNVLLVKIRENDYLTQTTYINNTNEIKAFKLINVGGSYWKGNANNDQLTRISGVAFNSKSELDEFIKEYEDKIARDHRTIGKDLELFTFDLLSGQGLPIWLPNGTIIKKEIRNFLSQLEFKYGFENTYTPIVGNIELYKKSGHWDHYKDNMFPPMKLDTEELVLRPMTCPHHILVYKKKQYSYKQLPLRLCEESMLHRYESSGGLTGFERVREMVLEDTHIFCTPQQVKDEVFNCYNMINEAYKGLGCSVYQVDLSLHDPNDKEKFHNDSKMWEKAENDLREMLKEKNIKYVEKIGEAAFYGPKIDFQVKTVLGRIITMSTIQLDFLLPQRFNIEFKNEKGAMEQAIMIHLGIVGTYERLLSILLEQTKGILPLWLSPKQIVIIPISIDAHLDYAEKINNQLRKLLIRSSIDNRDDRLSKKIRDAQISKIPYQIIIGDKEVESNTISVRKFGEEEVESFDIEEFIKIVTKKISNKS